MPDRFAFRRGIAAGALSLLLFAAPAFAADAPDDGLNAVLWMQRSVEYKGATMSAFALARLRLDQALADKGWTAAPAEQAAPFADKPPAVILDVDETIMDNSGYQAWNVTAGTSFSPKTWTQFVDSQTSTAIPGAVDFTKYAESKGVKVFYVTNRSAEEKPSTAKNLAALGFPMGGNVDTVLASREKPDWGSQKGTRRAFIAKDYRVLLLLGDNFGDFVDDYRGSEAERLKVFEANAAHWGRDWIVLPNPSYGSFESAPYGHDFKKSADEQRAAKRGVLQPWAGPKP